MSGPKIKKLVLVLETSVSITEVNKDADSETPERSELYRLPYIYYLIWFDQFFIMAFIDSDNKVGTTSQVLQENQDSAFARPT